MPLPTLPPAPPAYVVQVKCAENWSLYRDTVVIPAQAPSTNVLRKHTEHASFPRPGDVQIIATPIDQRRTLLSVAWLNGAGDVQLTDRWTISQDWPQLQVELPSLCPDLAFGYLYVSRYVPSDPAKATTKQPVRAKTSFAPSDPVVPLGLGG